MYTLKTLQNLARKHDSIVLATGFFDLLHQEHRKFLKKAAKQADTLVVAVESDQRARKLKGEGRPRQTQKTRAKNLAKLPYVDHVILLPDNFGQPEVKERLLKNLQPDLLAISSHTPHQKEKQKLVEKYGGKLKIVHQHNPEVSTTKILKKS